MPVGAIITGAAPHSAKTVPALCSAVRSVVSVAWSSEVSSNALAELNKAAKRNEDVNAIFIIRFFLL